MEIQQGYSYHIKDDLFNMVQANCETKGKKYGRCNTIVIGKFAGKENAYLIQNAFPIIGKYLDHIHDH